MCYLRVYEYWEVVIILGENIVLDIENMPRKIMDISLVEENKRLKQKEDITNKILRHDETYITLKEDKLPILYCSCCWDTQSKLVQLIKYEEGDYICNVCKNKGYYDKEKYKAYIDNMQNDNNIYV